MALSQLALPLRLVLALVVTIAYVHIARAYNEDSYARAWFCACFRYESRAIAKGVLAHLAATVPTVASLRADQRYRIVVTARGLHILDAQVAPARVIARVSSRASDELHARFDHGEIGGEMLVRLLALFTMGTANLPAFDSRFIAWLPACIPRFAMVRASTASPTAADEKRFHVSWTATVPCVRLHHDYAVCDILHRVCAALDVDAISVLLPCVFAGCTSKVRNVVGAACVRFRRGMSAESMHTEIARQAWASRALAAGNAMRLLPSGDAVRGAFDVILSIAYVQDAAVLPTAYCVRCESSTSRARVYVAAICAPCALDVGVRYVVSVDGETHHFAQDRMGSEIAAEFDGLDAKTC